MPRTRRRSRPRPGRSRTTIRRAASACASIPRVYQGYRIPPYYDSLIGKLIVHGKTAQRVPDAAAARAGRSSSSTASRRPCRCSSALVREPDIVDGDYDIHWLEQFLAG